MQAINFVRRLLLAIVIAYFGCVSMAAAQVTSGPAVATTNVNMRSGPGTNYPVVTVLRSGDQVIVNRCSGNWCLSDFGRERGWVSRSFLRQVISSPGGGGGGGRPGGPSFDFNFNIGFGQACFFENDNFRGRSFCLRQGESERNLGRWENRIGSISIDGRFTQVEACTDRGFRNCNTFTRDVPVLNFMLQRNISAVRVR